MKMKRVLIFADGESSHLGFYNDQLEEGDYIICADGGTNIACLAGIIPDIVMGDFDSINKEVVEDLKLSKTEFIEFSPEKDESDLELALLKAIEMKPEEVIIFGALGKRLDHLMANLMLLTIPLEAGIKCSILEKNYEVYLIDDCIKINKGKGGFISLFPLTAVVEGIETQGLKYPLKNEDLYLGPSRGLSNELIEKEAIIKIKTGKLLIIKTNN